jgi:fatty acid desaturase
VDRKAASFSGKSNLIMSDLRCPVCSSDNVRPSERDFKSDYSFLTVLAAVFFLILLILLLFFIVHLHPVIIILLGIALVTRMLEWLRHPPRRERMEMICLQCQHRFQADREPHEEED